MKKSIKKMENKRKIYFLLATVGVLLFVVSVMVNNGYKFDTVNANPDYICIKDVDSSCQYNSSKLCNFWGGFDYYSNCCDAWKEDGTRICRGERTLSVYYYHRRTTCESGYYRYGQNGDSNGDSGRYTLDGIFESEYCTIIEQDHVNPIGDGMITQ